MKTRVENYIAKHQLFAKDARVLVAVSGGLDSTVLAHMLKALGYDFAIAHCNFKLRGAESAGDQEAVSKLARNLGVEFHVKAFDTKTVVESSGKSVQMVARELRYGWFEFLCDDIGYDRIVVAQHKDDQVETVLLNMVRGAGLRGLGGMLPLNGNVARPLLCVSKSELLEYATEHQLSFRDDSSNASDDYRRNFLRNNVVDLLLEMNPQLNEALSNQAAYMQDAAKVVAADVAQRLDEVATSGVGHLRINIEKLQALEPMPFYLFEFLREYGFNSDVVNDVAESLDGLSGKRFYSSSHQLLKDREHLIVMAIDEDAKARYLIDKGMNEFSHPIHLRFEEISASNFRIPNSRTVVCFDAGKLSYPLELRRWQQGDFFYPLGMGNKKLLSDFFIDNKFSQFEKEKTWLLVSAEDIVWVVGHRIDHRFRIRSDSQQVMRVELR